MDEGKAMWRSCWITLRNGSLFVDECLPCNTEKKINCIRLYAALVFHSVITWGTIFYDVSNA